MALQVPLHEITKPLTRGERSQVLNFQESVAGMKLAWQMQKATPDLSQLTATSSENVLLSAGKGQGWKDCIKFYEQAASEPAEGHDESND